MFVKSALLLQGPTSFYLQLEMDRSAQELNDIQAREEFMVNILCNIKGTVQGISSKLNVQLTMVPFKPLFSFINMLNWFYPLWFIIYHLSLFWQSKINDYFLSLHSIEIIEIVVGFFLFFINYVSRANHFHVFIYLSFNTNLI